MGWQRFLVHEANRICHLRCLRWAALAMGHRLPAGQQERLQRYRLGACRFRRLGPRLHIQCDGALQELEGVLQVPGPEGPSAVPPRASWIARHCGGEGEVPVLRMRGGSVTPCAPVDRCLLGQMGNRAPPQSGAETRLKQAAFTKWGINPPNPPQP
jgi:hypothetical protein